MKKTVLFFLAFIALRHSLWANDFTWFDSNHPIVYTLPKNAAPVVRTAIAMWKADLQKVTGKLPRQATGGKHDDKATIRFIQYDSADSIHLSDLGVPVARLTGKKDAFYIKIKGNQLLVTGSDARGLAYGILELSRLAGVSPWVWWGDVTPDKKTALTLPEQFETFQSPSVEFRGIFINDEDWSLQPWSWLKFDPQSKVGLVSAQTYRRVFQLLLRLRANTLWPAMHGNTTPFYWTPGAKAAADSCGIVIGTSHCEPLMCNANGEWDEGKRGHYNYISNKDSVLSYWTDRLKRVAHSENIYTIGMRGKHDGPMEGVHTLSEKTKALQEVINDQRALLKKYVNPDLKAIPQQFVPYKEVLDIYENGLHVPDDVMLTWCDDNYGYIKRLSDKMQQQRSGGAGIYYHLSYWGRPHDYLWLTTTQPGLIYHEMKNAYKHNVKRLWIVNVHDPKVACYDLELFLDMAWDINLTTSHNSVEQHLENCLKRDYGPGAGAQLFPVMREFYRLTAIRKPEFMGWEQVELDKRAYARGISPVKSTDFSFTQFGDEADRYLSDYARLKKIVDKVGKMLPENKKEAFFAAIKYPVFGAADMAIKCLEAQRARSLAKGDYSAYNRARAKAQLMTACARSMKAYFDIRRLTQYYNNELAAGKWKHDMCFNPRELPVFDPPVLPMGLTQREIRQYTTDEINGGKQPGYDTIKNDASYIARNAARFDKASFHVHEEPMLGHSMQAVPLPKGESLSYVFNCARDGEALLRTAVIPTQPNDRGDIRYSVQIDNTAPQVVSFREKGRTDKWKQNVLRGQAVSNILCKLSAGRHTLKITALDDHVIIDQWMVDFDKDRKFYVFPVQPYYRKP